MIDKRSNERVLGIDPGFGRLGWAVVEGNRAQQHLVSFGCIETKAGLALSRRLKLLDEQLATVVQEYKPSVAVVEELFYFKNQKTVMQVAQARGVVVVHLEKAAIPVFEYTPLQVKQAVTGYGRADKHQMQQMVKQLLRLPTIPQPDDAADAVAVALTHLFTASFA